MMHWAAQRSYEEEVLVAKCVLGDKDAWNEMFRLYNPRLVAQIRPLLRADRCAELAEEIASRVWCSLCNGSYSRLRTFNPRTGRLLTYLVAIARREIWNRHRAELTRLSRESKAARSEATHDDTDRCLFVQEFLSTLTHREREFCLCVLMQLESGPAPRDLSTTNVWTLRHRVLKKFQIYCRRID